MEYLFSAGIVVFKVSNGQRYYLLLKYNAGHWDFAKGKIEAGETKEQAALRELHEEAGIRAHIMPGFTDTFDYYFTNYDGNKAHKKVDFFVGEAEGGQVILSDEHTDFAWLPYAQVSERLTFDNAKNTLKKADAFLSDMLK